LTKVCVTNGKNIDDHKSWHFLNSLNRRVANWFARYEKENPIATWAKAQQKFITKFNVV
jgi:hypothetical protein